MRTRGATIATRLARFFDKRCLQAFRFETVDEEMENYLVPDQNQFHITFPSPKNLELAAWAKFIVYWFLIQEFGSIFLMDFVAFAFVLLAFFY